MTPNEAHKNGMEEEACGDGGGGLWSVPLGLEDLDEETEPVRALQPLENKHSNPSIDSTEAELPPDRIQRC